MSREIESLHTYEVGDFKVRFWQEEKDFKTWHDNKSEKAIKDWYRTLPEVPSLEQVIDFLSHLDYCNAVQVWERNGPETALLIYPNWPPEVP